MKSIDKPLNKVTESFYPDAIDYSEIIMPLIVVYEHPLDFPDKYIARLYNLDMPTNMIMVKDNFDEILEGIPMDMVRFMPSPEDDACIVAIFI